ncbi:MAG TPA: enoyl-CoA hydratase/isomerase family protein [Ilumatobacteraceae bacterium]|nr:enoyl-CoA hydratase/isomerase family protein [Ilumatobacteraceae bacterium]
MDEQIAGGLRAVLVDTRPDPSTTQQLDSLGSLPLVVVGVAHETGAGLAVADVVVGPDDPALAAIITTIETNPIAATSLAVLLRMTTALDTSSGDAVDVALAAESATYSTLQAGAEFATWRAGRSGSAPAPDPADAVVIERSSADDRQLTIWLNRPHRHNAFSRSMRDALCDALALAVVDDQITSIELRGNGPSFCSGGDLGEFGGFDDPASAHHTRLTRSPARLMHRIGDRCTAYLHGFCIGAGIELPAFCHRIVATPDARIGLPEVSLGLVPGAGGTVSLPRRIGRQRTAYLALSGVQLTAPEALAWGLVDAIAD